MTKEDPNKILATPQFNQFKNAHARLILMMEKYSDLKNSSQQSIHPPTSQPEQNTFNKYMSEILIIIKIRS